MCHTVHWVTSKVNFLMFKSYARSLSLSGISHAPSTFYSEEMTHPSSTPPLRVALTLHWHCTDALICSAPPSATRLITLTHPHFHAYQLPHTRNPHHSHTLLPYYSHTFSPHHSHTLPHHSHSVSGGRPTSLTPPSIGRLEDTHQVTSPPHTPSVCTHVVSVPASCELFVCDSWCASWSSWFVFLKQFSV